MKLQHPFMQLPLIFDAERLGEEVCSIEQSAWIPHPQGFKGNDALSLIAPYGKKFDEELSGPMRPTEHLARCPYLSEVLQTIGGVWGRTRLMRLSGQAEVKLHVDVHYYWRERMRVHVPIVTQPNVRFYCGDQNIHMAAGECWIFDTWRKHRVVNDDTQSRIHLVADTVGGGQFWSWFKKAKPSHMNFPNWRPVKPQTPQEPITELKCETTNIPNVMTPWEMREHFSFLFSEAAPHPKLNDVASFTHEFCTAWHALWAEFGDDEGAYPAYRKLRDNYLAQIAAYPELALENGYGFITAIGQALVLFCVKDPGIKRFEELRTTGQGSGGSVKTGVVKSGENDRSPILPSIVRPLIIISAPRSGSTMLFETLSSYSDLYTIGGESHQIIESNAELHPSFKNYDSNMLDANDCSQAIALKLFRAFASASRNHAGHTSKPSEQIRLLEKTPKNALRIPFLDKLFPDACYIYLHRDPRHVISSMIDAWQSGRFRTYPELPGWEGLPWSLLLIPEWRTLIGKPLHNIVAHQWATATKIMLDGLEAIDARRLERVRYEELLRQPQIEINRICSTFGVDAKQISSELPFSKYTLTPPHPDKWKKNAHLVSEVWPIVEEQVLRAEKFMTYSH